MVAKPRIPNAEMSTNIARNMWLSKQATHSIGSGNIVRRSVRNMQLDTVPTGV